MKKRKARKLREQAGQIYVSDDYTSLSDKPMYEGHQPSTHLMVSDIENNDSGEYHVWPSICLLYTSPSPRDQRGSRMPSSA